MECKLASLNASEVWYDVTRLKETTCHSIVMSCYFLICERLRKCGEQCCRFISAVVIWHLSVGIDYITRDLTSHKLTRYNSISDIIAMISTFEFLTLLSKK
ncbi:MAG: hypothetical protein UH241_09920 [Acutalibacteraceae bacterium]|nr:hypothetical protein [Acutalibacteraceae bacterium]